MILPFPTVQVSEEERVRALMLQQKTEIEQQRIIIEQLKKRVDKINKDKR
tara:strand:- start:775 stop:924 length:150 start_codon:yes stop_codon:yes gene_type:complete